MMPLDKNHIDASRRLVHTVGQIDIVKAERERRVRELEHYDQTIASLEKDAEKLSAMTQSGNVPNDWEKQIDKKEVVTIGPAVEKIRTPHVVDAIEMSRKKEK